MMMMRMIMIIIIVIIIIAIVIIIIILKYHHYLKISKPQHFTANFLFMLPSGAPAVGPVFWWGPFCLFVFFTVYTCPYFPIFQLKRGQQFVTAWTPATGVRTPTRLSPGCLQISSYFPWLFLTSACSAKPQVENYTFSSSQWPDTNTHSAAQLL